MAPRRTRAAPHVLILTHSEDEDVPERVAHAVRARGAECTRIDTDRFPAQAALALTIDGGERALWIESTREIDLSRASALWCRRLWPARDGTGADDVYEPWAVQQARDAFYASLAVIGRRAVILDDPHAVARAEHKPLQLALAAQVGLSTPPTLVTNDAASARAFVAAHGAVVTKLLVPLSQTMKGDGPRVFTSLVDSDDLRALDGLSRAPQIFQTALKKRADARVVVVGSSIFGGALDAESDDVHDWKSAATAQARWRRARVPAASARGVRRLLRALGLRSGVVDFVIDTRGRWQFLEVNPAGEWGFLERDLGLPIARAFAAELVA